MKFFILLIIVLVLPSWALADDEEFICQFHAYNSEGQQFKREVRTSSKFKLPFSLKSAITTALDTGMKVVIMRCKFGKDFEFAGELRKNAPGVTVKKIEE